MPQTFEQAWRTARASLSAVPPLLLRQWAQEGYAKICDVKQGSWSWLRKEGIISVQAARLVAVTVTQGSTTVTSAGLFQPTDVGRQFRTGRQPIYTINTVVDANTVTLDMPYAENDGPAVTANIQDCFTTLPADFRRFLVIYDRYFLRIIPFWLSEDQIALADPGRVISDLGPRFLIARSYATATNGTFGQVRYEYWPAPTAFRTYPFLYIRRAEAFADSDLLPGVVSERSDLLQLYCMMRGSAWPGTIDQKNPAFSPAMVGYYQKMFDQAVQEAALNDDNEYPGDMLTIHWERRVGAIAPTGTLLRQTDATINDYY